tara:strand:+ start:17800 stop:18546 length:747 start_codon:yes stop_codon:yes gene_type:complete
MSILTSAKLAAGSGAAKMAAKVEAKAQAAKAAAEASAAKAKAQAEAAAKKKADEAAAKLKAKQDKARKAAEHSLGIMEANVKHYQKLADEIKQRIATNDLQKYMKFGSPGKRKRTKISGPTLKQLQSLARRNRVSIFKMRKDGRGYTKKPLTKKALKARLSRARVSYKNLKAPRTRITTRRRYVRSPVRRRIPCPVGSYRDPNTGRCKSIPKRRENLDDLDSVNFNWNYGKQMYGHSCFGDIPCDCGL